jgi:hypothetical protein
LIWRNKMVALEFNYFHVWKVVHFDQVIEVIAHIIDNLENSIEQQHDRYQNGSLRREEWDLGDDYPREVLFHGPFNSEAWDLDELVGLYLPSLERGAVLLALCSAMEDQFVGLCRSIAHFHKELPDITDNLTSYGGKLARSGGIERAVRYLEKVGALPPLRCAAEWEKVKRIGMVRNQFAHQNGRAPPIDELKTLGPEVSTVTIGRGFLEDKLVLRAGYLPEAVATFTRFADQVQHALVHRFPLTYD